jgi:hypothetical protein
MSKATFIHLQFTGMSLWTRVKLGLSLLLTPLTIVIMGRSIRVSYEHHGDSISIN